jgi:hypothetical protein
MSLVFFKRIALMADQNAKTNSSDAFGQAAEKLADLRRALGTLTATTGALVQTAPRQIQAEIGDLAEILQGIERRFDIVGEVVAAHAKLAALGAVNENLPLGAIATVQKVLEVGDLGKEGKNAGWLYAGLSEDPSSPKFNQELWVAPHDADIMDYYAAAILATAQTKRGEESRVPTPIELNQIFTGLASKGIGGFNKTGKAPYGRYWASGQQGEWQAPCQRFSDGVLRNTRKEYRRAVRFVR